MSTGLLMILLVLLISMSLVSSFLGVGGIGGNLPSPSQLASGNPQSYIDLLSALIPSPTGVLWFDLFLGILTVAVVVGGYRILNPFGG